MKKLLKSILEYLKTTKRGHYSCEDEFYNCPCFPETMEYFESSECICGANNFNDNLNKKIKEIEEFLNIPSTS